MPSTSIPRMVLTPLLRIIRFGAPIKGSIPNSASPSAFFTPFYLALYASVQRLDLSLDPRKTLHKLSKHHFTLWNSLPIVFMGICALLNLYIMAPPIFPYLFKFGIPAAYTAGVLIPLTSQFVWPATPIFAWLITFFCARYIPSGRRPTIHVALLPALESVLYGANISDLQTRYTNALLDVVAWLPYGVLHFSVPFVVALILWTLGPRGGVQFWGLAFGWMNLLGVVCQLVFPCAAPWYEIIHGLTPANYSMPGSPGGLLRIDRVFHSSGYTNTFGNAPLVFGAFPSLHSGCAVMEALFLSHFFPAYKPFYWGYVGVLWWATMYLSHHYLIDLVGGACLSVLVFYLCMPEGFKDVDQIQWSKLEGGGYEMIGGPRTRDDVDLDEEIRKLEQAGDLDDEDHLHPHERDEESQIGTGSGSNASSNAVASGSGTKQDQVPISSSGTDPIPKPKIKKKRSVSWGETKVLGEEGRERVRREAEAESEADRSELEMGDDGDGSADGEGDIGNQRKKNGI
ncbi:inositolphosphorylceramide synthase [Kwoniella heveanensis BCC8398]|uniref:Inositolphosphorylceramide synthase n=1 Tax=Kwoniella heveanensis BCC8398 TaxID=1296120 RepID=A0A1B9GM40_9TREE|nr:inositolphosphorylceramide synthase [Kwoniella heveanensis BCC8398]